MAEKQRTKSKFFKSVNFKLYCYWGLSSWNEQLWMFAAGMAFGSLGGSLQLTASAAFVASAAILLFGPTIGRWIDQSNRLRTALLTLLCTKTSVILTTAILAAMLHFGNLLSSVGNGELITALSIFCIATNMISVLGTTAIQVIITKDWVVVICHPDENFLTATNTILLQIKLIFAFISPYMAGELMVWTSIGTGCFAIALFTTMAFAIEAPLLYSIYRSVPEFSRKGIVREQPLLANSTDPDARPTKGQGSRRSIVNTMAKLTNSWKTYSHQKVLLAGISLSLLYMTVLGFDSITDVYAFSQGLKTNTVALVKGIGALSGFVGSFAYPRIRKRLGLLRAGMVAVWLELSCLVLPLVSVWLPGSPFEPSSLLWSDVGPLNGTSVANGTESGQRGLQEAYAVDKTSIIVFLVGIVLSRIGLWMADLAINQLFQETVAEGERASVGSVQNALNYSMDMVKNVLVICMPRPRTFGFLIIGSWISVFAACVCYMIFAKRHLAKEVTTDSKEAWTDHTKQREEVDEEVRGDELEDGLT